MSQEFNDGPKLLQGPGDQLAIAYDFEGESGTYLWEAIVFTGVVGFGFTAARFCSEEQVGAYDRLESVSGSTWAIGVSRAPSRLEHYRIYFDEVGCYEILATGFVPPAGAE